MKDLAWGPQNFMKSDTNEPLLYVEDGRVVVVLQLVVRMDVRQVRKAGGQAGGASRLSLTIS